MCIVCIGCGCTSAKRRRLQVSRYARVCVISNWFLCVNSINNNLLSDNKTWALWCFQRLRFVTLRECGRKSKTDCKIRDVTPW